MGKDYDEQTLEIDLTNYRQRRRGFSPPRRENYTANDSPLEHRLMVERDGEPDAWADHLRRCARCAFHQARADAYRQALAELTEALT